MALPVEAANPFTLLYTEIWKLATDNTVLETWLKARNKIDFSDWRGTKLDKTVADTPELTLTVEGGFTNIHSNSGTTQVNKTYSWILITSDMDINRVYNQVSWELLRSMVEWDVTLSALSWGSPAVNFVKNVAMLGSTEGISFPEESEELTGWATSWPFEVEMYFPTSYLRHL